MQTHSQHQYTALCKRNVELEQKLQDLQLIASFTTQLHTLRLCAHEVNARIANNEHPFGVLEGTGFSLSLVNALKELDLQKDRIIEEIKGNLPLSIGEPE